MPKFCRLSILLTLWTSFALLHAAELPVVLRTYMPEAAPSSFAVSFSNGVNVCFDPTRGSISYAWVGPGVDLSTTRPGNGKLIKPAILQGDLAYVESDQNPLRVGKSGGASSVVFKGYQLMSGGVVFHSIVDGVAVSEEIRPREDGKGFSRRFTSREVSPASRDTAGQLPRGSETAWYFPGAISKGRISVQGAEPDGEGYRFQLSKDKAFVLDVTFATPTP